MGIPKDPASLSKGWAVRDGSTIRAQHQPSALRDADSAQREGRCTFKIALRVNFFEHQRGAQPFRRPNY